MDGRPMLRDTRISLCLWQGEQKKAKSEIQMAQKDLKALAHIKSMQKFRLTCANNLLNNLVNGGNNMEELKKKTSVKFYHCHK
jgi:hypothetical protein